VEPEGDEELDSAQIEEEERWLGQGQERVVVMEAEVVLG
jgi:hypothetical protein